MDGETKTKRNWSQRELFKIRCEEVNAEIFNLKWNWSFKDVKDNSRQTWIYNEHKEHVAIWDESFDQVELLQKQYRFRENQYMVIGLTHHNDVVSVGFGVRGLAWLDDDKLFQATLFD